MDERGGLDENGGATSNEVIVEDTNINYMLIIVLC
jgi:hypothetical protein